MKLMDFTGFALKNLFSKPATKNYPAEPAVFARSVTDSATVKHLKQYSMPKCPKEQSFCVHFGLK